MIPGQRNLFIQPNSGQIRNGGETHIYFLAGVNILIFRLPHNHSRNLSLHHGISLSQLDKLKMDVDSIVHNLAKNDYKSRYIRRTKERPLNPKKKNMKKNTALAFFSTVKKFQNYENYNENRYLNLQE